MSKQMQAWHQRLRKDGWLIAALAAAVLLCIASGTAGSSDSAMTAEESRAARIFSAIEGAGKVDVAIYYPADADSGKPCGAVIVADGADDISVRLRLGQAASTLFGIDVTEIGIFKRGEAP